jgi:hypothetical protein
VARGPHDWQLPGKGLAQRIAAGTIGFMEGRKMMEPGPQPPGSPVATEDRSPRRYGMGPLRQPNLPDTVGTHPEAGAFKPGPASARRAAFSGDLGDISDADVIDHTLRNVRTMGGGVPSTYEYGTYVGHDTALSQPQSRVSAFRGTTLPGASSGSAGAIGSGPRALPRAEPPTGVTDTGQGYFDFGAQNIPPPNSKRRRG